MNLLQYFVCMYVFHYSNNRAEIANLMVLVIMSRSIYIDNIIKKVSSGPLPRNVKFQNCNV